MSEGNPPESYYEALKALAEKHQKEAEAGMIHDPVAYWFERAESAEAERDALKRAAILVAEELESDFNRLHDFAVLAGETELAKAFELFLQLSQAEEERRLFARLAEDEED